MYIWIFLGRRILQALHTTPTRLCLLILSCCNIFIITLSLGDVYSKYYPTLHIMHNFPQAEENLFFQDINLQSINNLSGLVDECRSQVPDIPMATVSVVNRTNPLNGRDYSYCEVETERGMFRSGSVSFQGG